MNTAPRTGDAAGGPSSAACSSAAAHRRATAAHHGGLRRPYPCHFKFGLDQLLPENIEFIHGPGCPVCVLPMGRIDACIEIASRPGVIFCTFGDAMRVPGKTARFCRRKPAAPMSASFTRRWTLCGWRSKIRSARWSFGLGFETTMPATALTLRQARERNVDNFYFSASTSPCCRPCAACWTSRRTESTPFSPRATSVW